MPKEITGSIPYKIIISDTNEWTLEYGSDSIDMDEAVRNDIASLMIAQNVMETCAVKLKEDKSEAKGKARQMYAQRLDKVISGRFGLRIICDYLLDSYQDYLKYLKKVSDAENKRG